MNLPVYSTFKKPAASEVSMKFTKLRAEMAKASLSGVRFRGTDWFAWITGGANPVVFFPSEQGIAEVFVTASGAWILTDRIESVRLVEEELSPNFEIFECAWTDKPGAYDAFIKKTCGPNAVVASDRPSLGLNERTLPDAIVELRLTFTPQEIERYRMLGRDAGLAMERALLAAKPDWTEFDLAAAGASEQWKLGIEPVLALVSGDARLSIRRHPMPTSDKLGGRAMMVFSARRHGLYANITRFVYFRKPSETELKHHTDLMKIEQAVLDATQPGATLESCYAAVSSAYAETGYAEELLNHHQGGTCGYGSREKFAAIKSAVDTRNLIRENSAVAWNPSLPGAKLEDTFLVQARGLLNMTLVDSCPVKEFGGRKRPWFYEG